jgi:hypothetical protein
LYEDASCISEIQGKDHQDLGVSRVFLPTGTGLETAVTGQTGPDRFQYRPVSNRPKFKIQILIQKNEKIPKNS